MHAQSTNERIFERLIFQSPLMHVCLLSKTTVLLISFKDSKTVHHHKMSDMRSIMKIVEEAVEEYNNTDASNTFPSLQGFNYLYLFIFCCFCSIFTIPDMNLFCSFKLFSEICMLILSSRNF
jgi:hypothetical protein